MRGPRRFIAVGALVASLPVLCPSAVRADDAACVAAAEKSLSLRDQGKLKDALATLAACADPSCPGEVASECTHRIDAINSALPTIIFAAKDGSGNDLYRVKVSMDGSVVAQSLDGRPLALDPGEHAFRFEVAGQPPLEKKLVLREGEKDRHEMVVIGLPATVTSTASTAAATPTGAPTGAPLASSWNGRKTLGVLTGGLGLVGLGLGIGFGAFASSAQSREKSDCSSAGRCSDYAQAMEDYNTANKDATGATIAWIAGGVLLATGVVLWVTAPSGTTQAGRGLYLAPLIGARTGGLSLGGDL